VDKQALNSASEDYLDEIVALRRDLHQHPELSGHERRTAASVAARLRRAGLDVRTDIGGHGVVAVLGSGEPCLVLRADMDALPLQEKTDLPFASINDGVMHACGHDFHTAWLAGAALVLQQVGLPRGSVKFVFQPAEEALGGARGMIEAGVLENPPVSAVCAAHVWPEYPAGQIALRPGPNLAAADKFSITITGAGTHGANPHQGRDPIPVAAEIVLALRTIATRRIDPLNPVVVSVCRMAAGSAFNIIPTTATLEGTVRTLRLEDQDLIEEAMGEMVAGIAAAHGCAGEVDYLRGVPATVTDPGMTELARAALQAALGDEQVKLQELPSMGGEDFAFFLQRCPGTVLWVGSTTPGDASPRPLHHPQFVGDEGCLRAAMTGLAAVALAYLSRQA